MNEINPPADEVDREAEGPVGAAAWTSETFRTVQCGCTESTHPIRIPNAIDLKFFFFFYHSNVFVSWLFILSHSARPFSSTQSNKVVSKCNIEQNLVKKKQKQSEMK